VSYISISVASTKISSWRQLPSKLLAISRGWLESVMTEFRELLRVAFSGNDGPHNQLSRHPTQIADHIGQLDIHLRQGFLHALHTGRRSRDVL